MRSRAAAKSYAKALFALARERDQADAVLGELAAAAALVERDAALRDFLARPGVAAGAKRAAADEIAARLGLGKLVRDFVGLAAAHGRGAELPLMRDAVRDLLDAERGRVRARVRSVAPLTEAERQTLAERLGRALGGRQVVLEEVVDPALLGGFVAESGSLVVDGSLDGQLARMRDRLARG